MVSLVREVAIVDVDLHGLAGVHSLLHAADVVLRNREDHGDRLQLRDHCQAGEIGGMHDIAGVDHAQPDAARDRRDDAAIGQLQPGTLDLSLIGLDRTLALLDQGNLTVNLLLRGLLRFEQQVISIQVELRHLERRLVFHQCSLGLMQLNLEGTGIDLGQQIPLMHHLAFGEVDAINSPSTRLCSVTVYNAVTVPKPFR